MKSIYQRSFGLLFLVGFAIFHHSEVLASAQGRRFTPFQYALLPALVLGNVVLEASDPPSVAGWKGGILVDDGARSFFRSPDKDTRQRVATAGDILLGGLVAYPFVVDAVFESWISNQDADTAGQISLIAAQGFLFTSFLRVLTKVTVGRERPFQSECVSDPNYNSDCGTDSSRTSFFSGHAAISFTGAGLICSAHESFQLSGGNIPCYVALGLATLVSLSRVIADRHYLSDSLAGMAIGITSGYFLPKWIHYGTNSSEVTVIPNVSENAWSVALFLPW